MKSRLKIYTLLVLLILPGRNLCAQNDTFQIGGWIVEDMPLFEDEDPSVTFRKYLNEQAKLHSAGISDSIKGRIIANFYIDTTGTLIEPNVLRGINKNVDSIAIDIFLRSPKWSPGRQRGRNAKVLMTFPIYFNCEPPHIISNEEIKPTRKRKKRR